VCVYHHHCRMYETLMVDMLIEFGALCVIIEDQGFAERYRIQNLRTHAHAHTHTHTRTRTHTHKRARTHTHKTKRKKLRTKLTKNAAHSRARRTYM
jgi:hypothetical protein